MEGNRRFGKSMMLFFKVYAALDLLGSVGGWVCVCVYVRVYVCVYVYVYVDVDVDVDGHVYVAEAVDDDVCVDLGGGASVKD